MWLLSTQESHTIAGTLMSCTLGKDELHMKLVQWLGNKLVVHWSVQISSMLREQINCTLQKDEGCKFFSKLREKMICTLQKKSTRWKDELYILVQCLWKRWSCTCNILEMPREDSELI